MERSEYERLAAAEERMWWFRGLHRNLLAAWRAASGGGKIVLDAGCGTGGFLKYLRSQAPGIFACGLELDGEAASLARAKSAASIVAGRIDAMPLADASLDAIFSADVLCHRGVEQRAALAECRRCLKPGGVLILNLPAYRWLFSSHDIAVANVRRYGKREVVALLEAAGFAARARYWNSILFPLMAARRKLGSKGASDVALLAAPLERLFAGLVALESSLASWGTPFPWGGSILAIAVRP